MIDVYSVGILLLFLIIGGFKWPSTMDIASNFEDYMAKAEAIIDLNTLKVLRNTIKKCLLLEAEPVDRITELLP